MKIVLNCLLLFFGSNILLYAQSSSSRPNIILIITDQQTANALSYVGNKDVHTPGIDGLARDGMLFKRSYVSYPVCGPSRASLITGKMPVQIAVADNGPDHGPNLAEEHLQFSLGRLLADEGYECLYAGKWHAPTQVNLPAEGTGFTKVCDMDDTQIVPRSIPYFQKKRDKPLFYVASFLNPHEICEYARSEFLPTGPVEAGNAKAYPQLPYNAAIPAYFPEAVLLNREADPRSYPTKRYTDDDWRAYLNAYYRLVERVDHEISKLVAALKANNLYDNSLILLVSDHGDAVGAQRGNQKRTLQEEVIRVPFIVKKPGQKENGAINKTALVNTSLDIYQTILDYADIQPKQALLGKSLRPILDGHQDTLHTEVFIETLLDGVQTRGWAVVTKDFKYVLYRNFRNNEQLFNLTSDPYEIQNLIVNTAYETTAASFRKKLYDWAVKTNDHLLQRLLVRNE
ncbi:sulfatase family protein [Sphingobacterium paludis]|uniref:Arylsulfatase A-like enzyme n=1 Tax=Sphingobacterium paludis TaxID=1476465 RepID=A0A4R7CZ63_9SPHI|nr:sulfatase-like hydrolase/transferase [Sphingobacterium paludis]TDS11826.1 arylsulfatase A-like enzyme [Sphingobacterium paludis]